jgi:hypothetical protein
MNRGLTTAGAMYGIREKQAQEAWGNILQQSTDENGNVDYPKAQGLAARAGPVVQMKMMESLKDTSQLQGQQIVQAGALHNLVGNMSASLMNDPSDANLAKIRASAVAARLPQGALAEIDRIAALPPEQRGAEAYKHTVTQLDALHQLARSPYAQPTDVDAGDRRVPVITTAATPWSPASSTVQHGGVTIGPPAGSTTPETVPVDDKGVVPRDANGQFTRPTQGPVRYQPSTTVTTAVPGVTTGGQQVGAPGTGAPATGGTGGPPPIPTPPPGTTVIPPRAGAYQPRPTGVAGGAAPVPGATPVPGAAPPPVPGAAPAPGAAPPPAPGGKPPVLTAPPQGQPQALEDDVRQWQAGNAAMPDARKNLLSGETALQALDLTRSGPGTATMQRIRAFFVAQGLPVPWTGDDTKTENYDLARKSLLRFAQGAGKSSGTDLGLQTQIDSNANTEHMVQSAARHVLIQDLGVARQRIAQQLESPDGGVGMGKHVQTFTSDTDPRGFAWDLYNPSQRAAIEAEAKKTKGGIEKLDKAIALAAKHHLIATPNTPAATPPAAARPAVAPPPAPQPNALVRPPSLVPTD